MAEVLGERDPFRNYLSLVRMSVEARVSKKQRKLLHESAREVAQEELKKRGVLGPHRLVQPSEETRLDWQESGEVVLGGLLMLTTTPTSQDFLQIASFSGHKASFVWEWQHPDKEPEQVVSTVRQDCLTFTELAGIEEPTVAFDIDPDYFFFFKPPRLTSLEPLRFGLVEPYTNPNAYVAADRLQRVTLAVPPGTDPPWLV